MSQSTWQLLPRQLKVSFSRRINRESADLLVTSRATVSTARRRRRASRTIPPTYSNTGLTTDRACDTDRSRSNEFWAASWSASSSSAAVAAGDVIIRAANVQAQAKRVGCIAGLRTPREGRGLCTAAESGWQPQRWDSNLPSQHTPTKRDHTSLRRFYSPRRRPDQRRIRPLLTDIFLVRCKRTKWSTIADCNQSCYVTHCDGFTFSAVGHDVVSCPLHCKTLYR